MPPEPTHDKPLAWNQEEVSKALDEVEREAKRLLLSGRSSTYRSVAKQSPEPVDEEITYRPDGMRTLRRLSYAFEEDWSYAIAQMVGDVQGSEAASRLREFIFTAFTTDQHRTLALSNSVRMVAERVIRGKRAPLTAIAHKILADTQLLNSGSHVQQIAQGDVFGLHISKPLTVRVNTCTVSIYPEHLLPASWAAKRKTRQQGNDLQVGDEHPSGAFRIRFYSPDLQSFESEVNRLLAVLRVYESVPVTFGDCQPLMRYLWQKKGGLFVSYQERFFHEAINIDDDHMDRLRQFIKKLYPALHKDFGESRPARPKFRRIAYDHYMHALFDDWPFESYVMRLVMALEALLNSQRDELKFRVTTRAALMLAAFGTDPVEVHERLAKAYDIRSTYAHGDLVSPDKLKALGDSFKTELASDVRRIILLWCFIQDSKDNVFKQLDLAMVSPHHRSLLFRRLRAAGPIT